MTDSKQKSPMHPGKEDVNLTSLASFDDSIEFVVNGSMDRAQRDRESQARDDQDAAEEAELHRATVAGIKIAFEKATRTENQTRDADLEAEQTGYDKATTELHRNYRSKRKRIEEHAQSRITELKQRLDEANWLAEAVFEAAETTPRENFEKLREKVETRTLELEEVCELARTEVRRYRQRPTEAPPITDERAEDFSRDPEAVFTAATHQAVESLNSLKGLKFARILRGGVPFLIVLLGGGGGALAAWSGKGSIEFTAMLPEIGLGLIIGMVIMLGCWLIGRKHVATCWIPMAKAMQDTKMTADLLVAKARQAQRELEENATHVRDSEITKANDKYLPLIEDSQREQETLLGDLEFKFPEKVERVETEHADRLQSIETTWTDGTRSARETFDAANTSEQGRHESRLASLKSTLDETQEGICIDWHTGMNRAQAVFEALTERATEEHPSFESEHWKSWKPSSHFPSIIPIGSVAFDRNEIPESLPAEERFAHDMPASMPLPAFLSFPDTCSLIIESDSETRNQSLAMLRSLMTRLLATMPPSKLRFTILDPVGLGEAFAGFMHLADHDEKLINDRIWTETRHIEQRLLDITEHMETVIQKYLRNEFDSIIDYNEAAGEIAEPLRFLVVSDFPANFTDVACKRLASIATSGPRCGVHTIILMHDISGARLPEALDRDTLHRPFALQGSSAELESVAAATGPSNLEAPPTRTATASPNEEHRSPTSRGTTAVGTAAVKADRGGSPLPDDRAQARPVLDRIEPPESLRDQPRPDRSHQAPAADAWASAPRTARAHRGQDRLRQVHAAACPGHQPRLLVLPRRGRVLVGRLQERRGVQDLRNPQASARPSGRRRK